MSCAASVGPPAELRYAAAMTSAAITDFISAHAAAWTSGDVEEIADAIGLPQMLARSDGTTFVEDDAELDRWIATRLADWHAHGVVAVAADVEHVEDLPDEAARVTSRWRLTGADGAERLGFVAVDTLACDDGDWYYVVTDLAGEDAALAGRS